MSDAVGITGSMEGGTLVLTISNPDKRNALKVEMRQDLTARIIQAGIDDDVRVIVIRGAGGHFCSGADVSSNVGGPVTPTATHLLGRIGEAHNMVRNIALGPKPVIAAVEGSAFGGGFALAAACDLVVAAEDAKFGAIFTSLGITAEFGLFATLPRRVGHQVARRIIYLAEKMSGTEAVAIGLADRLAPSGGAFAGAMEMAAQLSLVPPMAMAVTKRAFTAAIGSIEDALRLELDIMPGLARSEDFREAISAFKEKRKPSFTGR